VLVHAELLLLPCQAITPLYATAAAVMRYAVYREQWVQARLQQAAKKERNAQE
jgi:hypothetical protein